ncbi:glycosyltransferase family 4 protein [Gracilimonas sp.]|uniref:glycosyltransferase family 4 protein n=1 Tax=Gracilimonas sp. TaxID=1974203 RepID=UPI003BAD8CEA
MNVQLIQVLTGAIVAFGIAYFSVPILRRVAYHSDFYDKPDNDRKLHDRYVPTLGGVAIFLAFFVGFSISGFAEHMQGYPYFSAAMILLFFTGLKDDIVDLSAKTKLVMELVVAGLLIFGCGMYIDNFYGVFGIYEIPYWASVVLTTFTMIVVVNSYNLIDGIDGLAAGTGMIASFFFGLGFYVAGELALATISFILLVSLAAYLKYNFNPAEIFMGDTGSLVVGFLLAVLAINFVGLNDVPAYTDVFGATSPILPVAILALPLFDTFTVFYKRIRRGKSPFNPGRDHVHHSILSAGFGHKSTSILLYVCSIFITLIAISVKQLNINMIFATTLLSMFVFLPTNGFKRKILKNVGFDIEGQLASPKTLQELRKETQAISDDKEKSTSSDSGIGREKREYSST